MHRARAALAAGVALTVVAASLVPASAASGTLPPGADKLLHAVGYAVVSALAVAGWADGDPKRAAAVVAVVSLLGAGVEVVQPLVGRTTSLPDALANCAGAALGALAARVSRTR